MILVDAEKIDLYTARGWWGEETLWQLFQQRLADMPDAEAVVDAPNRADFAHGAPRRLTWAGLADEVDAFSLALLHAGLARDERVVVQLPNTVEQFVVYLACARLGLVVSPVPVQYREHELAAILDVTGAVAAVAFARIGPPDRPHAAAQMFVGLQGAHATLRVVLAWGDERCEGAIDLGGVARGRPASAAERETLARAEAAAAVTANDVFTICWTSGTEAQPKGVPRSHNEWLVIAPSIIDAALLQPGARLLNPFPLVNMAGLSTAFTVWLVLGATVVQHHPFNLPVFLAQLREERIDYTVAPPAILNLLLQNEAMLAGIDFARLSRIGSGSAPLSEWMVRGFAERGVQIVNYFGSNEGAALAGNHIDIPDPALRARVFPRADAPGRSWSVSTTRKIRTRLVDIDSGRDIVEAGIAGELRFSGPTIFSGYFGAPEQSARAFDEQGFYKSGDLFEIVGEAGEFYRYVGRSKDLVIRGGVNISSEEVESLLLACPGVAEAAVVGVPDARLGEIVCACVVAKPGEAPSLAAINDYLRDELRVAIFKLPERMMKLDALPRNPVGKILKRTLRERAAVEALR